MWRQPLGLALRKGLEGRCGGPGRLLAIGCPAAGGAQPPLAAAPSVAERGSTSAPTAAAPDPGATAAAGWGGSSSSGAGALAPFMGGPPATREFDLRQSFHKFPFRREVQLGIMKMGVAVPTRVQDLTIPKIVDGLNVFMLAQTGTGKTLAYVLPIVHKLLETNTQGFFPLSRKPRAIIVQPTRELAMQTIKVVRNFPVQSVVCAPGGSFIKESQLLHAGVDIVVGTPWRLILHLGKENMHLSQVGHIVFDEADTICDTFYEKDAHKIIAGLMEDTSASAKPQIIIVGATRTSAVTAFINKHLTNTSVLPVVTTDAHMTPPQVEQVFVPTRGKRLTAVLWDILAEVPAVGRKTLVFTNRVPTCKAVHRSMLEHGLSAVALHGNMHPNRRKEVWREFSGSGADVMVCTNLASRGLDFQHVHHVVLYDFPANLADYLHRVGRTARGGRAGRVTTITPRRYWPFVTKIQEAAKAGKPIEVRHATKNIQKILRLEQYQKIAQSEKASKLQKRLMRKRLGLPPARNVGTKETKLAMKKLDRRIKAIKQMRFLQKRGILKRGMGIPKMPDKRVEATETQTVSTLVRAKDGLLQMVPRRRREPRQDHQRLAEAVPLANAPAGSQERVAGADRRRRRPVM